MQNDGRMSFRLDACFSVEKPSTQFACFSLKKETCNLRIAAQLKSRGFEATAGMSAFH